MTSIPCAPRTAIEKRNAYESLRVGPETNIAVWKNFYRLLPLSTAPITAVGVIVDLSTGAYHDYDSPVSVTLETEGA